ncbi:hypothetical protein ACLI08_00840 [Flavobacterium sp. RNTU_13]|uniref:hypothetical protein n=1 Tax=Flavobacterium sp. RNTU_13 TaxID=3375145 RepID=UPI00398890E4
MKKSAIVIVVILAALFLYFGMPVFNFRFLKLPLMLAALLLALLVLSSRAEGTGKKATLKPAAAARPLLIAIGAIVAYIVVMSISSAPMFRSDAYRALIGNVKNGTDIHHHITPLDIDNVRVVDQDLAYLLGEKILGSEPALGSKTTLGDFNIQKVNGKLYWVAPLLHSGFFKWVNNRQGTPGYVMVSATNERDVKLVEQVGGAKLAIKYQPGAFFFQDLKRYLYFNGYMATGLTDYTFEIDDQGKPYWVVTRYNKQVGISGNNATGVVIVDAQSGQITDYNMADTPAWVDRVEPQEFIEDQLNDWGEYVRGYWNFSGEGKLQITEEMTLVYGENNKSYWYTGLSSVGKEESAVGFVLVDTRTKEATYYNQSGATEYAAQQSAEGKVQEKGYRASLPVPYNINNIPTYVMTLKDDGGLVKMYAMVSLADYTIVGVGNTMQETLMAFKNVYNMADNRISPDQQTAKVQLNAVVARIQSDIKNGNSFYYFTLPGDKRIFIGSSQISNELPVTQAGDSISVSFDNDSEKVINVSAFKNLTLNKAK